jgi:hypothetical protein
VKHWAKGRANMSVINDGKNGNDLQDMEAWLTALESTARDRFATALGELEAMGPELNARLSWSAALDRVRSLIAE